MTYLSDVTKLRHAAASKLGSALDEIKELKVLETPDGIPEECATKALWVNCTKALHESKLFGKLKFALRAEIAGMFEEDILHDLTKRVFDRLLNEEKEH